MSNFLDMVQARLVEELKRVTPDAAAATSGFSRATIYNWMNKGNAPLDKLALLEIAGVDVVYVLTGQLSVPAETTPANPREAALLDNYRHCAEEDKAAIERVVLSAASAKQEVLAGEKGSKKAS